MSDLGGGLLLVAMLGLMLLGWAGWLPQGVVDLMTGEREE